VRTDETGIFSNSEISDERVIEAAKMVGAHDFIMALPGGYDFDVKERGTLLSTGQRQLLAFVRVFLQDPKIVILDEATSSIDTESEMLIQRATELLTKDRTSIVIAHRLSTIQQADVIFVLEKGEIIERGKHNDLIAREGVYKRLYDLQAFA
jgi:ATP-binding cassette subfamily B protein